MKNYKRWLFTIVENSLASDKLFSSQIINKQAVVNNCKQKMSFAEKCFMRTGIPPEDYLQLNIDYIEAKIELNELEHHFIKNRQAIMMAMGLTNEILFRE